MNERDIFLAALALAEPAERTAYLAQACGDDATVRRRVEALLEAHAGAGAFLEGHAAVDLAAANAAAPEPTEELKAAEGRGDSTVAPRPSELAFGQAARPEVDLRFLQPGQRPGSLGRLGHYEMLEVLGRGAFGVVLKAYDDKLERVVALKVLLPELAAASPARKRFLREARAFAKVRHENIVQVYAVEEEPLPYLVMEYIPGLTLQQKLNRDGPLEVPEVLRLGRQIAGGLAAAHATGLIHRDIKPGNILLEEGPELRAKLTDFGLARTADDASLTQSGYIAGTPLYMAPEQADGQRLDHRADLFSLGSVLYVMCTGRPPFRAATTVAVLRRVCDETPRPIREIIPEVPQALCDLIGRLHAKDPAARPQSAAEVANLLDRPPERGPAPAAAPRARRLWWVVAVLAVVAALAAGVVLYLNRDIFGDGALPDPGSGAAVAPSGDTPATDPGKPTVTLPGKPSPAAGAVAWLEAGPVCAGHKGAVHAAAFAPNGPLLATAGADGTIRVWAPATGKLLQTLAFSHGEPLALTFFGTGQILVAGGDDYGITGWDTDTWAERFDRKHHETRIIRALAPLGKFFVATGKSNGYHFFNVEGNQVAGRFLSAPSAWSLATRPDRKRIAIGLGNGLIEFWTNTKEEGDPPQKQLLMGHTLAVRALAFSADGHLLVSGSADATIKFWSGADGKSLGTATGHEGPVLTLALSPDGKHLISGGEDHTVRLWNTATFQPAGAALTLPAAVRAVAWAADGQTLATTTAAGAVQFWHVVLPR
jgi:hypothetical protein